MSERDRDREREKKSWRDIDKQRDGSSHRKSGQQGGRPDPRRQKSYRAKLDRLFDSGRIGELVEQKSGGADESDPGRIKLMGAIKDAEGRAPITSAVDAYLEKYPLPMDADVLAKVLEHRNPSRQLDALEMLLELTASETPRRTRAIVGQCKLLRDTSDEPDLKELAIKLLDRLE